MATYWVTEKWKTTTILSTTNQSTGSTRLRTEANARAGVVFHLHRIDGPFVSRGFVKLEAWQK